MIFSCRVTDIICTKFYRLQPNRTGVMGVAHFCSQQDEPLQAYLSLIVPLRLQSAPDN